MVYDSEGTMGHIKSQSLSNYTFHCSQRYSIYNKYYIWPSVISLPPLFLVQISKGVLKLSLQGYIPPEMQTKRLSTLAEDLVKDYPK